MISIGIDNVHALQFALGIFIRFNVHEFRGQIPCEVSLLVLGQCDLVSKLNLILVSTRCVLVKLDINVGTKNRIANIVRLLVAFLVLVNVQVLQTLQLLSQRGRNAHDLNRSPSIAVLFLKSGLLFVSRRLSLLARLIFLDRANDSVGVVGNADLVTNSAIRAVVAIVLFGFHVETSAILSDSNLFLAL